MPKPYKWTLSGKTAPQKDFTLNNQSTQKDIQPQKQLKLSVPHQEAQPEIRLIIASPPLQQNNVHPTSPAQQDPNLNISNIDLCILLHPADINTGITETT